MDKNGQFLKDFLQMKKSRLEQLKRERENFLSANEAAQDLAMEDISILERQVEYMKKPPIQDELQKK